MTEQNSTVKGLCPYQQSREQDNLAELTTACYMTEHKKTLHDKDL